MNISHHMLFDAIVKIIDPLVRIINFEHNKTVLILLLHHRLD
jgi:hypothetical protein